MKKIYMIITILAVTFVLFCIDLQNFNNGETFGNIRTKINANNDSLEVYVDSLMNRTEPIYAFATLFNHDQTLTGTDYVAIDGAFSNVLNENFIVVTEGENSPYLQYVGSQSIIIEVNGAINFEIGQSSTVTFALRLGNGTFTVDPNSEVKRYVGVANGIASVPGYYMGELDPLDKIQIVVKTDKTGGNTISNLNMQVGISRIK